MVRNFDLYRAILQRLEDCETPNSAVNAKDFSPYGEQEVAHHMRMLDEKGLIKANIIESSEGNNLIDAAMAPSSALHSKSCLSSQASVHNQQSSV